MKETRIPYSLPMARARRAGLKTQTRRHINANARFDVWPPSAHPQHLEYFRSMCPYGQPGDVLLPIEPWRAPAEFDATAPREIPAGTLTWLDAQGPAPAGFGRYRHARFMPKHLIAARDELVAVRVERLHDISEADAIAEGCSTAIDVTGGWEAHPMGTYRDGYALLWEQINGPGSWAANPWI